MATTSVRIQWSAVGIGMVAAATSMCLAASGAAAVGVPAARPSFGGSAFGSTGHLGSVVNSGKSAYVPICTRTVGKSRHDSTVAVHLPGVGTIGAVTTRVSTGRVSGGVRVTSRTHTAKTTLLSSVHAGAITTLASATRSAGRTRLTGSSTFVGLSVAGQQLPAHVPANSKYALPGVGSVVVNAQHRSTRFGNPMIVVQSLVITVGAKNSAGLPAGRIVVGRSVASLHNPTHRDVKGYAYGTRVSVGNSVKSGATAPVYLPCGGTGGATESKNSTVHAVLPPAVRSGEVSSRARSTDTAAKTSVLTSDHIARAGLFNGMVVARGITTRAHATRTASGLTRSSKGTTIAALTINGQPRKVSTKPNQKYRIPGLGTLWIHRVTATSTGLSVNAAQLILSRARGSLPAGAVITLGAAHAAVLRH